MAASIDPALWLPAGYTPDAANHLIKLSTSSASSSVLLAQLTDAKAANSTGDIRQIKFAIDEAFYQAWLTRGSANQTTDMRLSRSIGGDSSGNINYIYQTSFTITPTGIFAIPAEP